MSSPEAGFNWAQFQTDIIDYVSRLGLFDSVQNFELTGNIGQFVAAVFPDPEALTPVAGLSGTNVTSLCLQFVVRIYIQASVVNPDVIDPRALNAAAIIMRKFNEGFTFTETIYAIDLLGEKTAGLRAVAGYAKVGSPGGSALYRIVDIRVPVLLTDIWQQER